MAFYLLLKRSKNLDKKKLQEYKQHRYIFCFEIYTPLLGNGVIYHACVDREQSS